MEDFLLIMWKPLLACLVLTGIHAYLGLHVLERKIVFVDLALAQIAALGAILALLFGVDLHSPVTYWFALTATFIGAGVLSFARIRNNKIPQEAIIGIIYIVATALAILVLSQTAEGDEHIRYMMVGNILLVDLSLIIKTIVLYTVVGVIHWRFQTTFVQISRQPEKAYQEGKKVRFWDFLFYLTFGAVVTSSVQIGGVLLVFSYLIIPAVMALLLAKSFRRRLICGWLSGAIVSFIGVFLSFFLNLPTGPTIVCSFGLALLIMFLFKR